MKNLSFLALIILGASVSAQPDKLLSKSSELAESIEASVIEWRHHFHQNPELSNREFKTAEKIAEHLKSLGLEVQTGVAKTGVVAILKGGKPGPVVGLRADIDALPVTERAPIKWASKATSTYNNIETGVMHACGHDTHISILMAVAEVLSKMKAELKGTVKFIFQPAEEGAPPGEEGGAKLMIKEGVMKNPDIDVMFGLHINAGTNVGEITYKPGGTMAAADRFVMKIKGKQSHGSTPWTSIDPIMTASMIIQGLQTIISRQTELTKEAAVISVGLIRGGVRNNIIPEEVEMIGTIRTLDPDMQDIIHEKIRLVAKTMAASQGATVDVDIQRFVPVTYNNPELTARAVQWLENAAGADHVTLRKAMTGAEDFSFYANEVPSVFFFVGGCPIGQDATKAAPHHTPDFFVHDDSMMTGIKALLNCTLGYMYEK
ncbi:MAG: amidohydrolase [Cytophagales bacterium]|nr:amidohydrolase [Cytophagales bacterium]